MKMKNKIILLFVLLISTLWFAGCNNKSNVVNKEDINITIVIKENDEEVESNNSEISTDNIILLDILKENFTIEEENGFITSINGLTQNPEKNIYWLYSINGEFANVGAGDYKVENNDVIEFNLKDIENE